MAVKKAKPKPKPKPKVKAAKTAKTAYSCRVCGSFAVIDPVCGCAEEHLFICCGQPMTKASKK